MLHWTKTLAAAALLTQITCWPANAQINPFGDTNLNLTKSDAKLANAASARIYKSETATIGAEEGWENPETGNSGKVTLTRIFQHRGMLCKQLAHRVAVPEFANPFDFVARRCEVSPGVWKAL